VPETRGFVRKNHEYDVLPFPTRCRSIVTATFNSVGSRSASTFSPRLPSCPTKLNDVYLKLFRIASAASSKLATRFQMQAPCGVIRETDTMFGGVHMTLKLVFPETFDRPALSMSKLG
jgi:hypothetical protein